MLTAEPWVQFSVFMRTTPYGWQRLVLDPKTGEVYKEELTLCETAPYKENIEAIR